MNTREQAIEAAKRALHADDCGCTNLDDDPFYEPVARIALDAAVPVLLNDLADRIGNLARPGLMAYEHAAEVVRAAAGGWGQ